MHNLTEVVSDSCGNRFAGGHYGLLDVIIRFGRWQYFVTLTHRRQADGSNIVSKVPMSFLRACASALGVRYPSLVWTLRREVGEVRGRGHYHALLAAEGSGALKPSIGRCFHLRRLWEKEFVGGFADVRIYQQGRHGASYVLDCLGYSEQSGANRYESQKFASGMDCILSDSLSRFMMGYRHGRHTDDGAEGYPGPQGRFQVTTGEKWAKAVVSKDKIRLYRSGDIVVPTTREVLPVNGAKHSCTVGNFHRQRLEDPSWDYHGLNPAQVAMLHECADTHSSDRKGQACV